MEVKVKLEIFITSHQFNKPKKQIIKFPGLLCFDVLILRFNTHSEEHAHKKKHI